MPTFGKTTIGANTYTFITNELDGCRFQLTENGDVTKITLYCKASSGSINVKCLVYADSAGAPAAKKGTSAAVSVNTTLAWRDFEFSPAVSLTAGYYWLFLSSSGNGETRVDDGQTNQSCYKFGTYCSEPDPCGSVTYENNEISIYATYTTAGATYTKTWATDVLFKKLGITKTAAVDSAFKKSNITKTYVIDSLFKKLGITKPFEVDVDFLKKDIIKSFAVDARFGAVVTYTVSKQIDALFKKLGITRAFGIDAYFGPVGAVTYTKSFALDVVFAYKVRLPEIWLDEEGKIVLNVSRPYVWVGG